MSGTMKIAIVDYGCGNLFSLQSSLAYLGLNCTVTGEPEVLAAADKIILPGVGAFGQAMEQLRSRNLHDALQAAAKNGKYILGICLGMQMLFSESHEYGLHAGLGLIPGSVCPLEGDIAHDLKIPHMGWNALRFAKPDDPLLAGLSNGSYMYFVHSFYAKNCDSSVVAYADYDCSIPALVNNGRVYGAQFHPEKSGDAGLALLRAFAALNS